MNTKTEGHVEILRAVNDELVRVRKDHRVAISGGKAEQYPVVLFHRTTQVVHVGLDESSHRDGCVEAQELFDRYGHQFWLVDETREVLGMLCKVPEGGANRAPRRVNARNQY